jgi:flagellar hook-associated protein 1 FlgK
MAARIDDLLGDQESGLDPVLQQFFDSMQAVANNPTSIPARQVLLSDAESLVNRFDTLSEQFDILGTTVNDQLLSLSSEVTSIAASIAELNLDIVQEEGLAGGQPPNDLLDKRDALLSRLSELVSVSTIEADDGSLNVFIGNGQTLVLGGVANSFVTSRNRFDQSEVEISFQTTSVSFPISNQLTGGIIGGLLEFRDQVLKPAQDNLGRIAIGLASTINTQHQAGDDLAGNAGGLFFNNIVASSPEVLADVNNNPLSGTVSVAINNVNQLKASDYQLTFDGVDFTLLRLSDNTIVDSGFVAADFPRTVAGEGITLSLSGGVSAGDNFLIRPVRQGGSDIAVALTDAAAFAAAANGTALGDNSNVLTMVGMQNAKLMGNGTETYQTAYGKMVASVGVQTSEARANASSQQALLQRAEDRIAAVSGVNLDEEAANLLRYQQAYQAAARVFSVANDIFTSLLNATGR